MEIEFDPVFLVGTTRSGTTLLSLMLDHHPDIAFAGESEWIWDFPARAAGRMPAYHVWLEAHRHYRHHGLRTDRSLSFDELARSFLEQMRAAVDAEGAKRLIGWQLHRHYAAALALYPRARFIHLVRDGRDVCASWLKFGWLGNAYEAGLRWRHALAEWQAVKPRIAAARRVELRFEDLIRAPERELARLCDFLGAPYAPEMLAYHRDTTYERPDPGQAGKWRQQLSRRELRLFESVAAAELAANGYEPSGQPSLALRPWSRAWLRLDDKLRHHRARVRIYGPRLWLADVLSRRLAMRKTQERVRLALNEIESARLK
jgi:hypothetical protein